MFLLKKGLLADHVNSPQTRNSSLPSSPSPSQLSSSSLESNNFFLSLNSDKPSESSSLDEEEDFTAIISDQEFRKIVNFRRLFEHIKEGMESFEHVLQLQKLLTFCVDARELLVAIENPFIKAYGVDAYNQVEEEFNLIHERIQKLYQSKKESSPRIDKKQTEILLPSLPNTESISNIVSNIQKHLIQQKNQESSLLDQFGELNEDDDDLELNEQEQIDTQVQEQEKTKEELSKLTSMLKEKAKQVNEFIKSDVDSIKRKSVVLEKSKSSLERAQNGLDQQISLAKTYLYSQITFIVTVFISFIFMILLITIIPRII